MREIKWIVVHCSATPLNATIAAIQRYWREVLKWKAPGYHVIIEQDGKRTELQPFDKTANGVAGHNANAIHVCTIGGQNTDDRTTAQKDELYFTLKALQFMYPNAVIRGHRDFPNVAKACPRYDARKWFEGYMPFKK
jgi:N-acetylmuramoyl-L-alanine amidase